MHKVKCPVCYKVFDADVEPYVKDGRRYIHKDCYGKPINFDALSKDEQEKAFKNQIIEKYFRLLKKDNIELKSQNYSFYQTQINDLVLKGYTLSGIYYTLVYCFDLKKKSTRELKEKGLFIIPYYYEEASNFVDKTRAATAYNNSFKTESKEENIIVHFNEEKPKIKLFDF